MAIRLCELRRTGLVARPLLKLSPSFMMLLRRLISGLVAAAIRDAGADPRRAFVKLCCAPFLISGLPGLELSPGTVAPFDAGMSASLLPRMRIFDGSGAAAGVIVVEEAATAGAGAAASNRSLGPCSRSTLACGERVIRLGVSNGSSDDGRLDLKLPPPPPLLPALPPLLLLVLEDFFVSRADRGVLTPFCGGCGGPLLPPPGFAGGAKRFGLSSSLLLLLLLLPFRLRAGGGEAAGLPAFS